MMTNPIARIRRGRGGFSLIEIMVAMAILGVAFTSLFAMQVRLMTHQRRSMEQSERNAVLTAEIGRVESMRYTALDTFLVWDTLWVKDGVRRTAKDSARYERRYTITDNGSTIPICLASNPCKDILIQVVPLKPWGDTLDKVYTTIRRAKTPTINPLFTP